MRGRSCPQPFLVERSAYRPDAFLLLPRWATRSPPHPPQCAHWGTFPPEGKALGGGGTAGWNLSFTNMLSNIFSLENASQIGLGIPEETAPLSYQRQRSPKRANKSERAMNPGSRGLPLVFFPPTFFKESRAPPPESAGDSRRRVHPATVPTELLPMTEGPGPLSPHFSGEMGTPAGQAGQRGAAPRGLGKAPPTRRVRSTASPPGPRPHLRAPAAFQDDENLT